MIFYSVEMRWFIEGAIPGKVKQWFMNIENEVADQEPRKDYYYSQTAHGKLGAKLREGMIELKQLQHEYGMFSLAEGHFIGNMASWSKWSFKLNDELNMQDIENSKDWIAVKKDRLLIKYEVKKDNKVKWLNVDENTVNGCEVELSKITCKQQTWWSLCFEAFGKDDLTNNLIKVAEYITQKHTPDFTLTNPDSLSYPEWISQVLSTEY